MAEFRERQNIDNALHPERQWAPPLLEEPKPFWDSPEYQGGEDARGKPGSAQRYFNQTAETTRDPNYDPNKSVGSLADKADRYRALNGLNQQQGGDLASEQRCGAYVLLGGAMLGGGESGIATLMDSVEKFNAKNGGAADDKTKAENKKAFDALREKMAKGEALTQGDLNQVASGVYDMMSVAGKDGETAGMKEARVQQLMKESPALAKMWKDNDLSYDAIDPTGAGQGGHAVLGIGHGKSDKDHSGQHAAIYDPYRRTEKDPVKKQQMLDAGSEVEHLKAAYRQRIEWGSDPEQNAAYESAIKDAEAKYAAAMKAEQASHKDMGQVITDKKGLAAYRAATDRTMEMTDKGPQSTQPPRTQFEGIYY